MKRRISIFTFLLSAFAVVGLSAFAATSESDSMRVSPIGYRLDATGDIMDYAPSVVTVTPGDTSIVSPKKPVTLTAVLDRDYKVVSWQKFDVNPTVRTEADPIEEFGEKSEAVSVSFATNVTWMYVTVVVKYEPVRTVKASLSSFAKGTVTVSPSKASYQKGDVVTLTAEPAEGYSFVRWSDGNADHVRELTLDGDVDLKAYIEPDSSRVSFSAGEGAAIDVTEKRVSFGNAYGELPVPVRPGVKFSGWMDDEKRTVTAKTEVSRIANHTLYAFWGDLLYEIAWDFTGRGNGRVDGAGTYAYGSQPTLKAVPYEGSAFTGWTDGVTLNPRRITVLSNALYVAAFDVATYDVTFTYRDAAGNPVTKGPTTVEHGGKVDPPTIPEWPEHTFTNWSTEEYKKVTRDLAVEAIYDTMTYKVMFAYRDWQGNCVTTMPQHVVSGGKANPPDRSVVDNWTGNTFKGWAPDYNVIRQDTLCEAIYEINTYTVTFSYRGPDGELRETSEPVRHGDMVKAVPETAVVDNWPGHRFLGWSNEDYRCPIVGNLKVIARYEGYCEIDYRDALGTNLVEEVKDPKDWTNLRPVAELNEVEGYTFEKIGYEFSGWKTNEAGNVVYGDGARVRVQNGDVLALVSEWEPIQYTLRFDGNGGTCDVKPVKLTYDDPAPKPLEFEADSIFRSGYKFTGFGTNGVDLILAKPDGKAIRDWHPVVSNLTTEANATVTLYAIWQGEPQEVTINGEQVVLEYGSNLEEPAEPTPKTGYTFTGKWHTNNNVTVDFPITVTGGFDLDPNETTNEYTVAFHGNGADGKMDSQAFVYDKWQTLTPNGFTRTGYTFMGWATNETGTAVYKDRQSVRNLASDEGAVVDLYAVWAANAYTVRFNPGEGKGEMADQQFVYGVAQALSANRFTRDWYVFAGWTNETATGMSPPLLGDGEVVSNLTAEVGGVVTLTATWTDAPSYTVAFDGNGADGGSMATNRFECGKGGTLASNKFTRTGYVFANWTNATATGMSPPLLGDGAKFEKDLAPTNGTATLKALWTPNRYWVAFDGNDADDGTMAAQAFTYDVSQALTSNAFTKTGHSFGGWATNETGSAVFADGAVISNLTAEADATNTLWATWRANKYTVVIDGVPTEMDYGSDIGKPADPAAREGYTFADWTTNGASVATWPLKVPLGGIEITSAWTTNTYAVEFRGTGDAYTQNFTYGIPQNLTPNTFTAPEMMVFDCWTNAVDSKSYTNRETVCNLATGGVFVLYATWKDAPSYAVAFDGNGADGGSMATNRFECGKGGTLASNKFTWTGYVFANWTNETATGMSPPLLGDGATFSEDLAPTNGTATLKALWTPNRYWVKFEGNDADDGTMAAQAFTYDVSQALTSNAFTKTGHSFGGWATNETTGAAVFADGAVVSNLTAEADATNTLFATWRANKYPVVIDGVPTAMDYGSDIERPSDPAARDGYTFADWTTNGASVATWPLKVPLGGIEITSAWTTNKYTVEFRGPGDAYTQNFTYDIPQNLTPNTFTPPEMMVFDRWTNAVDSATYTNCATVCNLATGGVFVLYATWKDAPSYAVAFDGNGADGGSMATNRFECGKGGTLPANTFMRTGYVFDRWTNKVNGATFADGAPFTEDLAPTNGTATLKALWTPNRYWVKFDGNDADGGAAMTPQAFTYDVAQALTSNAFTRTGYGFAGWTDGEGAVVTKYADGAVVSNLTAVADATNTLWATWKANNYKVKFHSNGGSGEMDDQSFTYDQSHALAKNTFGSPVFWKVFVGWATNATGSVVYGDEDTVSNLTAAADGQVDLYAVWGDDSYTVTFDGNDATGGSMEPQKFKHGGTGALTSNAYTRIGHTFKNWTDDAGSVYSDGVNFTAPATGAGTTLHAAWTVNEYKCTFDDVTKSKKYGEAINPPQPDPTKTGYAFKGWTTNGADLVDFTGFTMPAHAVVFTSVWEPIEYTIAFNGNGADGGVPMASTNVKYDVEIALPSNTYERAGYAFVGWSADKNAADKTWSDGQKVSNLTNQTGTVTLFAVWLETGNPYSIALGLDPNFEVEVSPDGAWEIIGKAADKQGLRRMPTSPDGTLRVRVPSAGKLNLEFNVENIGEPLTVKFEDEAFDWLQDDETPEYEPGSAGRFEFSGTPSSGSWTLKNFMWTPAK